MAELGDLKLIDVRSMWPYEASDFTPWLAREENITRLAEAVGIELEVENTEVAVGPYSADIVATNSGTGGYVVIENQLGKTDHDHLGKAITYSAVLAASAVVWVAAEFTEEHRKALDWLNDNSSGDLSFFGVRVELWQIDDSKPAVRFNVLSQPTDAVRRAAITKAEGKLTDAKKLQLDWWTGFRDALAASKMVPSVQTPGPRYWYNVALGRTGFHLSNIADTSANRIGVRLYMRAKNNGESALAQLREQKVEIETEIGSRLSWDPNPNTVDKVVAIYRDADLTQRDDWPEHTAWMVEMTGRFRKAFADRIKDLDLDAGDQLDPDSPD